MGSITPVNTSKTILNLPCLGLFEMEAGWGEGEGVLGSLSNDDDDGNKNGKKTIGLDWQNNNFARASCFLVHFFAVIA